MILILQSFLYKILLIVCFASILQTDVCPTEHKLFMYVKTELILFIHVKTKLILFTYVNNKQDGRPFRCVPS